MDEKSGNGAVFSHKPVLFCECMEALDIKESGVYVDGTVGGGGHSSGILARLRGGRLICIDRDDAALEAAKKKLAGSAENAEINFVKSNFSDVAAVLDSLGVEKIDGLLLDLGVSSYQLDTPGRGFSYNADAPLDMRMDATAKKSAFDVVNGYSAAELKRIIYEYGEERYAPRIAEKIAARRSEKPIETTGELVAVIKSAMPAAAKNEKQHPAKRTFQAIRIEVNGELDAIEPALRAASARLNPGGRIAVITFHSLEDRIVKNTFADMAKGCICPPDLPVCVCGRKPQIKILTKKPVLPSETELSENPRSRSAKLRAAMKTAGDGSTR